MIARIWRGRAEKSQADAYHRHATETVFPSLMSLAGHRGASLLRREVDGLIEFVAVTHWESPDDIRSFAGDDIDKAVVEPEAQAVLVQFDNFARHYEIVFPVHSTQPG